MPFAQWIVPCIYNSLNRVVDGELYVFYMIFIEKCTCITHKLGCITALFCSRSVNF